MNTATEGATPLVTTVVPTYNEGDRLAAFLHDWSQESLACADVRVALIVVDDGSDSSYARSHRSGVEHANALLRQASAPHTVEYVCDRQNRGKGAAIRRGWEIAPKESAWLGFVDADGAVGASEYWRVTAQLRDA